MTFQDIKELTITGNIVVINGVELDVTSTLDAGINAVQYHKGFAILEETDNGFIETTEAKYQHFIDEWVAVRDQIEADRLASQPTEQERIMAFATSAIEDAIQAEINTYNHANGIALASVHNAESYSRVPTYTHRAFCEAVWLWSVELWEFMREWQFTLLALPTEQEILFKIQEKPFVFPVV